MKNRRYKRLCILMMVYGLLIQSGSLCIINAAGNHQIEDTVKSGIEEETENKQKGVSISIDSNHVYEGMKESYADGYLPIEEGDTLYLVVPFVIEGPLKNETLRVSMEFEETKDSPFKIKNYLKEMKPQTFEFEEEQTAYLYTASISLQKNRIKGQYPIKVKASGYDIDGKKEELEYTVFAQISGKKEKQDDKSPQDNKKGEGKTKDEKEKQTERQDGEVGEMEANASYLEAGSSNIEEPKEIIMHQPKFILEKYSLNEKSLEAGSFHNAEFTFQNKSRQFAAYNLKVTISQEGNGLGFSKQSEYYEKVGTLEEIILKEEIWVREEIEPGSIPVEFLFEYEDEKGTAYSTTETYLFQVHQPVNVTLEYQSFPNQVTAAETFISSLQIVNLGKAAVYNVRVFTQGGGVFSVQSFYGGTLEPGTSTQGDLKVYVGTKDMKDMNDVSEGTAEQKYGETDGELILEYEDAYGQTYSEKVNYTTEIQPPKILTLKTEEEEETNQWWISILVLLGASMAFGIVVQSLRVRNLKKSS